ncbi:MAG: sulfurtransferase TusA family protein [Hyphomicrobiales bacterium]
MSETILDVKGLKCPLPVLKIQKAMKSLASGDILEVHTTDPMSVIDVPAYCNESGNGLLSQVSEDGGHIFKIECA